MHKKEKEKEIGTRTYKGEGKQTDILLRQRRERREREKG